VGRPEICVAVIGSVSSTIIGTLENRIADVFGSDVYRHYPAFDLDVALDPTRKQYDSTRLLQALHAELPDGASKLVGITDVDLFVPIFTFVFGEAQLNGRVALASTFRLRNSFYGLPEDDTLLADRLVKEAVHELGHTFGLIHCSNPTCVMHVSPDVDEVDVKDAALCGQCREIMGLSP
jgi:archaemetzincin